MPCNSDYLYPNESEVELSRVVCLLDEAEYGLAIDPCRWNGSHPKVYNKGLGKADADWLVSRLCDRLRQVPDIRVYSLELQIWWRNHLAADAKRVAAERAGTDRDALRATALAKLTPAERDVLTGNGGTKGRL